MLLFLATPCLVVAVQPCMEWIPIHTQKQQQQQQQKNKKTKKNKKKQQILSKAEIYFLQFKLPIVLQACL